MPRRMTTTQLELFSDIRLTPVAQTPPWQSLPGDTRQTLTRFMTRLITEHAGAVDGETDHEA